MFDKEEEAFLRRQDVPRGPWLARMPGLEWLQDVFPVPKETDCQVCGKSVVGELFTMVEGLPVCAKCIAGPR